MTLPKRAYKIIASFFLLFGIIFLLNSSQGITGLAILDNENYIKGSYIALWFIIATALILTMERRGKESPLVKKVSKTIAKIDSTLKNGRIGTYRECVKYAEKLGYEVKPGSNHYDVFKGHAKITEIPFHDRGDAATGTYRKILKLLRNNAA